MNASRLDRRTPAWALLVPIVLGVVLLLGACAPQEEGGDTQPETTPPAEESTGGQEATGTDDSTGTGGATLDGATLVQERCTTCHTLDRVQAEDGDRAKWTQIVDDMIARGAQLDEAERTAVIDYLAQQYPDN